MFCPMCGAPNEDDADFCGNCGATLNPDEAAEAAGAQDESPEMAEEELVGESVSAAIDIVSDESAEIEAAKVDAEPEALEMASPRPMPPAPIAPVGGVPTSGMAVAALVMGIVGLTILPLVGSILALIFGYMARNDIRQRPDEVTGDGFALTGIVMGWIAIGLSVVFLLVFGGIAVCGVCGAFGASGSY